MQQHVQTLVCAQEWQTQTIVEVHEFLSSGAEGGVHLCVSTVASLPKLRVAHCLQEVVYLVLFIL